MLRYATLLFYYLSCHVGSFARLTGCEGVIAGELSHGGRARGWMAWVGLCVAWRGARRMKMAFRIGAVGVG